VREALDALRIEECAAGAWKAAAMMKRQYSTSGGSFHRVSGSAGSQRLQQSFERVACVQLAFGGD